MEKSFKEPSIIFVSKHTLTQLVELVKVLLINFSSCSLSTSALQYRRIKTIATTTKVKQNMFSNIVRNLPVYWNVNSAVSGHAKWPPPLTLQGQVQV